MKTRRSASTAVVQEQSSRIAENPVSFKQPKVQDSRFESSGKGSAKAATPVFAVTASAQPQTESLPDWLQLKEGKAAAVTLLDFMASRLGVTVPEELRAQVVSHPESLLDLLVINPKGLNAMALALNAAKHGHLLPAERSPVESPLLPNPFPFESLRNVAALRLERPASTMKQIAPGLYTGDLPSQTPDAQVHVNMVCAEMFQRLSQNPLLPDGTPPFSVTIDGVNFTSLDKLLEELERRGYQIEMQFERRIANFANLKVGSEGHYRDLAAPVMIDTQYAAGSAKAIVPAAHSETIISIKSTADTKGPLIDGKVRFFQGISGTGFFPSSVHADPAWCGKKVEGEPIVGHRAFRALSLCGAYAEVVNQAAQDQDLLVAGYGLTGVCNDSQAIIQLAMGRKTGAYPLMMHDEVLNGVLGQRLSDKAQDGDWRYEIILKAMKQLPNDIERTPGQAARALASIPWPSGQETFESSKQARAILRRE